MTVTHIEDWEPYRNAIALRELMPAWLNRIRNGWDAKTRDGLDAFRLFGKYRSALMETAKNARIWGLDPTPFYELVEIDQNPSHPDFQRLSLKVGNLAMKCRVEAEARWEMKQNKAVAVNQVLVSVEPDILKPIDKAIALLSKFPHWTNKKIASLAGISAGNLGRNRTFKMMRALLKKQFGRRGYRDSNTGNTEAIDNDE